MAVPQGCVRVKGNLYRADRHGRLTVRNKASGEVRQQFPVDINEMLSMSDCPIEIVTPPERPVDAEDYAGHPNAVASAAFAATGVRARPAVGGPGADMVKGQK